MFTSPQNLYLSILSLYSRPEKTSYSCVTPYLSPHTQPCPVRLSPPSEGSGEVPFTLLSLEVYPKVHAHLERITKLSEGVASTSSSALNGEAVVFSIC